MPKDLSIKRVLVIGSCPIIIGQAAEFDYSGTQACQALREEAGNCVTLCLMENVDPVGIHTGLFELRQESCSLLRRIEVLPSSMDNILQMNDFKIIPYLRHSWALLDF